MQMIRLPWYRARVRDVMGEGKGGMGLRRLRARVSWGGWLGCRMCAGVQ